jgi:FkbM family methyltransferase
MRAPSASSASVDETLVIGTLKRALAGLDIAVVRQSTLQKLENSRNCADDLRFLADMRRASVAQLLDCLGRSRSQNRQDLFALAELGFPSGGYFVEFGATDGVLGSNSYLMEKDFGWRGIVAEPARCWHERLCANRSCAIDTSCVWRETGGTLEFSEVDQLPALSTLSEFRDVDSFRRERSQARSYPVETVSLQDLLARHGAPPDIDYLSIDTEGSELEILRSFNFDEYHIRIITCEHNYTPAREEIHSLLRRHGYQRKYEAHSRYDDWYVLGEAPSEPREAPRPGVA